MQWLHVMQRRSSMVIVPAKWRSLPLPCEREGSRRTSMHPTGHFFWQAPQKVHVWAPDSVRRKSKRPTPGSLCTRSRTANRFSGIGWPYIMACCSSAGGGVLGLELMPVLAVVMRSDSVRKVRES